MRGALVNGSYDPVTLGHVNVIRKVACEYDIVYVAVLINEHKQGRYTISQRLALLRVALKDIPNAVPIFYAGDTIELCKLLGIDVVVRGVRSDADIEYDKALMKGYDFDGAGISVRFVQSDEPLREISSTMVREGDDEVRARYLPAEVYELLKRFEQNML